MQDYVLVCFAWWWIEIAIFLLVVTLTNVVQICGFVQYPTTSRPCSDKIQRVWRAFYPILLIAVLQLMVLCTKKIAVMPTPCLGPFYVYIARFTCAPSGLRGRRISQSTFINSIIKIIRIKENYVSHQMESVAAASQFVLQTQISAMINQYFILSAYRHLLLLEY